LGFARNCLARAKYYEEKAVAAGGWDKLEEEEEEGEEGEEEEGEEEEKEEEVGQKQDK